MEYIVSEIHINPIPMNSGHLGFCKFTINGDWVLNNVAIYAKADGTGIRLVYPKTNGLQAMYPISASVGVKITKEIEEAYLLFMK